MILKGKNINLRPIRLSDAKDFVKWLKDPEVNKFTTRRRVSLKEEIKWLKDLPKKKNEQRVFAIETKKCEYIGSASFADLDLKMDKDVQFTILIGDKKYWNKGLGTEATELMLDYAFRILKLHRVYLYVYSYNSRAIKIYKKLGFKKEGVRREEIFYKGKFYDNITMAILDREWKKSKNT